MLYLCYSSCLENLAENTYDTNKYYKGSTIPNWNKYLNHQFILRVTLNGTTPIQLPFNHFGIQDFHYNDNYLGTGTLSIIINENGLITASGSATFYIDNITLYKKV